MTGAFDKKKNIVRRKYVIIIIGMSIKQAGDSYQEIVKNFECECK